MTPKQVAFTACLFALACVLVGRRHRDRWVGAPFHALAALVLLEVAPAPWLQRDEAGRDLEFPVRVARDEILGRAMGIHLAVYAALALGLLVAGQIMRGDSIGSYRAPADVCRRALVPALAVTAAGALSVLIVLAYLLPSGVQALGQREAFVNENATSSGLYGWAFQFAPLLFTGGLALVLLGRPAGAAPKVTRLRIGFSAVVVYVAYQALIGGRGRVIFAVAAIVLAVHHGNRRIRIRHGVALAVGLAVALSYIYAVRFNGNSGVASLPGELLANKRVHDVAFMVENVPGTIDRAGVGTITAGLSHTVPVAGIPGTVNVSDYVSVQLLGSSIYQGNAATNYATAAELYLSFSMPVALLVAAAYGLFFGAVLDLCRRYRSPFSLLVAVLAAVAFYQGASSRMPSQLASFLVVGLLPAAAIAAAGHWKGSVRHARNALIYVIFTAVFAMKTMDAMGLGLLAWAARGLAAAVLVVAYIASVRVLRSVATGRPQQAENRRRHLSHAST